MQIILGWVFIIFPGILFLGQLISSINFSFAQKLGFQEDPEASDPLLHRVERYTAYWDLVSIVWLPVAGILMVLNISFWPLICFFAGAVYLDSAGREAAKNLGLRHEGIRMGTNRQQNFFFATYVIMAVFGLIAVIYPLGQLNITPHV